MQVNLPYFSFIIMSDFEYNRGLIRSVPLRSTTKLKIKMKQFPFISAFALFVIISHTKALHYPQYMQTFMKTSCVGDSWRHFLVSKNDFDVEDYPFAISMSVRGVWKFKTKQGINGLLGSVSSETCIEAIDLVDPPILTLTSVSMMLPVDLDDPVLGLFNASDYTESHKAIIIRNETVFDTPIEFDSWAITGSLDFQIFEEKNFAGRTACLIAQPSESGDWGLSFHFNLKLPFPVKSVRRGCILSEKNNLNLKGNNKSFEYVMDSVGKDVKLIFQTNAGTVDSLS